MRSWATNNLLGVDEMKIKLFIDDERFPVGDDWVVVRTSQEAIDYVVALGRIPDYVSFDHDLGGDDTSKVFINWLIDKLIDKVYTFPPDFDFYVHSQNPVGAKHIHETMLSLIQHFGRETN